MSILSFLNPKLPEHITCNGYTLPVQLIRRKGMKNIRLRMASTTTSVVISAAPQTSTNQIQKFLKSAHPWIEGQLKKHLEKPKTEFKFDLNSCISVLGKTIALKHEEKGRTSVSFDGDQICVRGAISLFDSMVRRGLKRFAMEVFTKYSTEYADKIGVTIHKIQIKDTKSCWGSCSAKGHLSYCWRVIFAPQAVLRYLCAHEVSHLKHMNHSKDFWKCVELLCPDYVKSRTWLKTNGQFLLNVC